MQAADWQSPEMLSSFHTFGLLSISGLLMILVCANLCPVRIQNATKWLRWWQSYCFWSFRASWEAAGIIVSFQLLSAQSLQGIPLSWLATWCYMNNYVSVWRILRRVWLFLRPVRCHRIFEFHYLQHRLQRMCDTITEMELGARGCTQQRPDDPTRQSNTWNNPANMLISPGHLTTLKSYPIQRVTGGWTETLAVRRDFGLMLLRCRTKVSRIWTCVFL